jgi:T-complex protein 1 subunit beta
LNIARTTLSSKIVHQDKEHFASLCVEAVMRLNGSTDLQAIHIIKKVGGSLRDSKLTEGFVLEKRFGVGQPKLLLNPKILIANTAMDADRNKIFGVRVRTDSTAAVAAIEEAERKRMIDKCQKIVAHGVQCKRGARTHNVRSKIRRP